MIDQTSLANQFALDVNANAELQRAARQNSPEALKAAAKQFEALFMNMVMKSMRDASPQDGIFDSDQTRMYTSMLDQQVSQSMASRGIGLADMLVRQLSRNQAVQGMPAADAGARPSPSQAAPQSDSAAPAGTPRASAAPPHVQAFRARLAAHAEQASRETGIPAGFMLGQAALESGWGKREIAGADGSSSHNLFGIKATRGWKGKVVEAVTTEYVNGVAQRRVEKFRAYDSYADAFRDYARMLRNNPRYGQAIASTRDAADFAGALQRAGYATDPNYAAKLTRIIKQTLA